MAKNSKRDHPEVMKLKRQAKEIRKRLPDITHMQAIELAARAKGFRTYASFLVGVSGDRACPPCNHNCRQGRDCPARKK